MRQEQLMQQEQEMINQSAGNHVPEASQEEPNVRSHIPKISKTKSFDHSQDRSQSSQRTDEHLGKVKTGQVNEKRNFWIRSTSADRMGGQTMSPAPRRRRIDGWNSRQKENK